jgi:hypothetical protein
VSLGVTVTTLLAWLSLPMSGSATHELSVWVSWHGRAMVLAWAVLLPVGVLVARFFKVWPGQDWPRVRDNPRWWRLHLHGQLWGAALAVVGLGLIWGHAGGGTAVARAHGLMGWIVMSLAGAQVLSGLLRGSKGGPTGLALRGDHFDMTPRRKWFEVFHKSAGYLAILAAWATLALGLVTADAPRWMVLALLCWAIILIAAFAYWQSRERCMDTYQAIWGNDADLPGLQMNPIGWGIHRVAPPRLSATVRATDATKPE